MTDPVAEAREQLQRRMRCGQCHNEMLEACGAELDALIAAVRAEEREACLLKAEFHEENPPHDLKDSWRFGWHECGRTIAAAIRARGTP
jgi:hypothetical protein